MTNNVKKSYSVSTPGRICLFGEHQDYLGLPVIPCAISLRVSLQAMHTNDSIVKIALPDINSEEIFSFNGPLPYVRERDYFRSAVNVLRKHGFTFSKGIDAIVQGKIPINTGTSSSSALVVAWINLLTQMSDQAQQLEPALIAKYAHETEVLEFGEPGGMMDHYSTALGGIIFLEFTPATIATPLHPALGSFVLGDSGEPKDTKSILARVKNQVISISKQLSAKHSKFSLMTTHSNEIEQYKNELTKEQTELLYGTLENRKITYRAKSLLQLASVDGEQIGTLMNDHQQILRDVLRISTPKINRMIDAACTVGAYGGKINGSGGGGCMFVYAPERTEAVAEAIERAGGKAFIVTADTGTRTEQLEISNGR
ncbi:MAG: galactokinase family protein [Bacteroidota bacterium]|nr:galactokinase family protein [Bacteroidota bacterium]